MDLHGIGIERVVAPVLGELAPHVIGPDQIDAADLDAFDAHARRLTLRAAQATAALFLVLTAFAWPTDLLLYPAGSPVRSALFVWRVGMVATCLGTILATTASAAVARRPFRAMVVALVVMLGLSGYLSARAGGIEGPLFHGINTAPFTTVLLIVPVRRRILATAAVVLPFLVGSFGSQPEQLREPMVGLALIWIAAASISAVLAGHVVYYLIRLSFLQHRALDRRTKELQEMDRLKNEFFANVSHELRTPLTNILGALRSVQRRGDGEDDGAADTLPRAVEAGLRNAAHLLGLVDDLLDLARFDSGRARPQKQVVDLAALLRRLVAEFESEPEKRVRVEVLADGPVLLAIDARQIRTVLANLLGNAFKFSDGAAAPVEITLESGEDSITLTVRDHGIGIAPEQQARIFERFYQVEGGVMRRHGGAGIGLALVREIVALHGGSVTVESELGAGSTFRVRLPRGDVQGASAAPTPEVEAAHEPHDGSSATTIDTARARPEGPLAEADPARPLLLVCEDDDDLRDYLGQVLAVRYRVATAPDGAAGLALARRLAPHLILADVMMPHMSGSELLAEVRADAGLRHTPCILLTARKDLATKLAALEQGADDYLHKPFEEMELLARVHNQLELRELTRDLAARVALQTRELRDLALRLASLQEKERERVARELHDELGQVLTGLQMQVEWLEDKVAGSPPDREQLVRGLHEAAALISSVRESVSRVVNALRPTLLEERGFAAAVRWLGQQLARHGKLACEVTVGIDEERLSPEEAIPLYRIVQEALTNVGRHAEARAVEVSLEADERAMVLRIRDDGRGFDLERAASDGSFGLLGIRERSRLLGGDCAIASAPGRGTEIVVTLPPLRPEAPAPRAEACA